MTSARLRAGEALARLARWPRDVRDAFWLAAAVGGVVGLLLVPWLHAAGVRSEDAEFGGVAHDGYIELARSLVRGDGYVFEPGGDAVSHRPPLYPLLLAPIALLPGPLQRPVLTAVQIVLLAAGAASTFALAARWFGPGTARIAFWLLILNPWLLWLTTLPMVPIAQMACYVWLLRALFAAAPDARVSPPSAWAGLPAGALALIHGAMPVTIALLFAAAGVVALRRDVHALKPLAAAAALMVVCIAPWSLRNWLVFQRFVPVATNAGLAYFAGTAHWGQGPLSGTVPPEAVWGQAAGSEGMWIAGVDTPYAQAAHYYGLRDIALSQKLDALAWQHAREDLPRLATKLALNGLEYYLPVVFPALRSSEVPWSARLLHAPGPLVRSLFYLGMWALAVIGLLRPPAGRGLEVALVAWALFAFALPYLPFLTFAGFTACTTPGHCRASRSSPRSAAARPGLDSPRSA